ncbi:MAG: radical SAM protein [Myxococcales bacterium]|nr:radical SAM protein [Myxococcales bacterium]
MTAAGPTLRVHAVEPRSRANGPGTRFVVWVQGCTLGCPGCFNPGTHDATAGRDVEVAELLAQLATSGAEGLTVSGGEPLEQAAGVLALLRGARAQGRSTLVFSGFALDELRARPLGPEIVAELDVLIDGRYVARERLGVGLRGSANQQVRLLTDRYAEADIAAVPEAEVRIGPDGAVVLSGVAPLPLRRR